MKRIILPLIFSALCLGGCYSVSDIPPKGPMPESIGAKAAAAMVPGQSTPENLKTYAQGMAKSAGADGETVYTLTETRPGPTKHKSICGPIYSVNKSTTITTKHSFLFKNGRFVEHWANESAPVEN